MMVALCGRLKFYAENTSLHGIHYIAEENKHPVIRFIWVIIISLSIYGMAIIFKGSYEAYTYNAISFVTETAYLDWNTTFPAVSICEITSSEMVWTSGSSGSYSPVQQFLSDLVFFTGSCYSCNLPCAECKTLDFKEIVRRFRKPCTRLLKTCRWNSMEFDCCEKFLPIETEYGLCFAINSLHTEKTPKSRITLHSNRKTGPGEMIIEAIDDVRFYFHAPEDVPFINSDPDQRKDVMLGETYGIAFNVIEIENDENVRDVTVDKRGCRFPRERPKDLKVHKLYSYSSCVVQCHADAHIDLCNCTHHLMPGISNEYVCNVEGLKCLTEYFEIVNRLHAKGFDKPGLVCECVPSCIEPEYKVVSNRKGIKSSHSEISIKMQSLPTSRFKRNVVRSTLDLVVSIGGNAGLFIGASLLSIIETVYLLCLRW